MSAGGIVSGEDAPAPSDHWDARLYDDAARFVSDLGGPVAALLAPQPGERILDLGCGDGALTAALAAAGAEVVGLDASPDMVEAARARGIEADVLDAHRLAEWAAAQAPFDAVFSNAALHWMTQPLKVFDGVFAALRPGGRFVAEQGGLGNVAAVCTALRAALAAREVDWSPRDVWSFPSPEEQRLRLEAAGFDVTSIALIPRPTPVEAGLRGWLSVFAPPALAALPEDEREGALEHAEALCAPSLQDLSGAWSVDYVRLRFEAVKPLEDA